MKTKIYFIIIFGLLFLHPRYSRALEPKQFSVTGHSFQKNEQDNSAVLSDSQNLHAFFSTDTDVDDEVAADVDVDDDDDVSFSARKKISFERTASFDTTPYTFLYPCDKSPGKYSSPHFYHLSPSHFIALRVFRI